MRFKQSFKIALNIILHSKLRSWLTIIGIVIGIAAVVAIISIGQGAQRNLEQNLNTLNANILTISPGFSRAALPAQIALPRSGGHPDRSFRAESHRCGRDLQCRPLRRVRASRCAPTRCCRFRVRGDRDCRHWAESWRHQ